ncbi:hypothetical protein CO037_00855 [Candidatus Pacearchaeota archaeon CG_4_9_14_0_2_um_filter_30_8]|nr:MAG: hypothetical protein CO037_00855 [Candidatus Pacearchaeota archaeon CG_4_9_14_0_2_um_filter_30_8]
MDKIKSYEVEGREKENLHKCYHVSLEKSIYKIKIDGEISFNFYYTSLTEELKKDLDKTLNQDLTKPNSFLYAIESFSRALNHLLSMFSSPKDLSCFSGNYSVNMFLAKDFDEFCSIGRSRKGNYPSFAQGRVSGTTLVYIQRYFITYSKKNIKKIPKLDILGNAHELLHIFFHYNNLNKNGNLNRLPFLLNEGLNVICANQISKKFNEEFISSEHLFLEPVNVFDYDKRWITENRYYQSAGQFMNYLLKKISKKEKISYKESFQKMFNTIGNSENFNDNKFDAKKFFSKTFGLDISKEYNSFLEKEAK